MPICPLSSFFMNFDHVVKSDAKRRPKPFTFRPPKPNRLVSRLIKWTVPSELRRKLKVNEVDISDEEVSMALRFFRWLAGEEMRERSWLQGDCIEAGSLLVPVQLDFIALVI